MKHGEKVELTILDNTVQKVVMCECIDAWQYSGVKRPDDKYNVALGPKYGSCVYCLYDFWVNVDTVEEAQDLRRNLQMETRQWYLDKL